MASPPNPLAFMAKLSDAVFVYRPPSASPFGTSASAAPRLVILLSWMNAQPAHIAKYLTPYRDGLVFPPPAPPPTILLIRADHASVFKPSNALVAVRPAIPVLKQFLQDNNDLSRPQILVHTFSNGGSTMLGRLYMALAETSTSSASAPPTTLPPHVTIFDSSPGHFRYATGVAAMSVGLERQPLLIRLAGLLAVHANVAAFWLQFRLLHWLVWLRLGSLVTRAAKSSHSGKTAASVDDTSTSAILAPAWEPHNRVGGGNCNEVRRAYLFSDGDPLVLTRDVEEHAAEARAAGFTVARMENFGESNHVAHARADPERYWRAVRETWEGKSE